MREVEHLVLGVEDRDRDRDLVHVSAAVDRVPDPERERPDFLDAASEQGGVDARPGHLALAADIDLDRDRAVGTDGDEAGLADVAALRARPRYAVAPQSRCSFCGARRCPERWLSSRMGHAVREGAISRWSTASCRAASRAKGRSARGGGARGRPSASAALPPSSSRRRRRCSSRTSTWSLS